MKVSRNILFAAVFALLVFVCFFAISRKSGKTANTYCDGVLYESIDLEKVEDGYTVKIGEHNTILVENGQIRMYEADCPDKLCIKQGAISDARYPIVCLPNKVVIRIEAQS